MCTYEIHQVRSITFQWFMLQLFFFSNIFYPTLIFLPIYLYLFCYWLVIWNAHPARYLLHFYSWFLLIIAVFSTDVFDVILFNRCDLRNCLEKTCATKCYFCYFCNLSWHLFNSDIYYRIDRTPPCSGQWSPFHLCTARWAERCPANVTWFRRCLQCSMEEYIVEECSIEECSMEECSIE